MTVQLRPLRAGEESVLETLLAEPEVRRWWPDGSYRADSGWVVEADGEPVGWIGYEEEDHSWYPSVAFDVALTSARHGRGIGRRALRIAVDRFKRRGHHRFTLDPNVDNARAIRCYEAVGFRPVGVMRCYERAVEGGWNDALLMELVELDERG